VIVAHAIGGIKDLPIPGLFFLYGGAAVLAISFIALGVLWTEPHLEEADQGSPLQPPILSRILLSRTLRIVLGTLGTATFALALATSLVGSTDWDSNLAPTLVWVIFWLALVWLSVLVGNVWTAISPFRAVGDLAAWLTRRHPRRTRPYPWRLGRWPGAVLLFSFAAMELVYPHPNHPRALGVAMCLYAAITFAGMLVFGRSAWLENGEAFNIYFGLFSRISPFAVYEEDGEREILVRPPLVSLANWAPNPGSLAFVSVMLGTVVFDGLSRTSSFKSFIATTFSAGAQRRLAELVIMLATVVAVATAYSLAVRLARVRTDVDPGTPTVLSPYFLASLVPIALVYSIAHYFTLLIGEGQLIWGLISDPFGHGWNLFGTAGFEPNLKPLTTHEIWYIQVGALVIGHMLGIVLAHDRAVSLYEGKAALRSQYAMLTLMIVFTVGGLYLLSRP
jgi:hypothetical protein